MNKLIDNSILSAAAILILAVSPFVAAAQITKTPAPNPRPKVTVPPAPEAPISRTVSSPRPDPETRDTSERSIKVSGEVNFTLGCVLEGTIKVNGWSRNEIRVFIHDGSKVAFQTLQKDPKSSEPVWIKLVAANAKGKYGAASDCIAGNEIEIDVPLKSTIVVKGREISTSIEGVRKVEVESIGGDVSLRNITNGISVKSGQGDITVAGSDGAMTLNTTTGNILVFEAGPSDFGDVFKANTNSGAIALQSLKYRQVNVASVTGSVAFTGEVQNGGFYDMRTSKGSIRLSIPVKSAFQIWATYGFGNFTSDIPIDISTENVTPGPIKIIRGKIGNGDASLKLSTNNGSISIKKM